MPEHVCARGMFEAIQYFNQEPSIGHNLRDIHVVNLNCQMTELFTVIFKDLAAAVPADPDRYDSDISSLSQEPIG